MPPLSLSPAATPPPLARQAGLQATMLRRVVLSNHAAVGDTLHGANKSRGVAFFAVSRLLVGLAAAKCRLPECDLLPRSPTSPLDLRAFSALSGHLQVGQRARATKILFLCSYENYGKAFVDVAMLRKHAHVHGERQYVCQEPGARL